VPSLLADASQGSRQLHHSVVGRTLMTSGDMLEYLYHTQTISVKCRQTTRVVIIYIGCDLLF
jgi:hypothetical protein